MEAFLGWWQVFILGMGRVGGLVALAPVIGGRTMPMIIKVLVTLILTLFCISVVKLHAPALDLAPGWMAVLIIKEMVIGLIMGFTVTVVIAGCQAAGEFMGFQMMFTAASTFMAYTEEQSTVISNYFYILAVLIFVSLDGQHWLIQGLVKSFEVVPVYGLPAHLGPMQAWVRFFGNIFEVGLHLALPLMGTLLVTNLMLGMIARTMPQLNVFVVGLPVQILAGILLMIVMISGLTLAESTIFKQWSRELLALIHSLGR